jgi:hypothetical protein
MIPDDTYAGVLETYKKSSPSQRLNPNVESAARLARNASDFSETLPEETEWSFLIKESVFRTVVKDLKR